MLCTRVETGEMSDQGAPQDPAKYLESGNAKSFTALSSISL